MNENQIQEKMAGIVSWFKQLGRTRIVPVSNRKIQIFSDRNDSFVADYIVEFRGDEDFCRLFIDISIADAHLTACVVVGLLSVCVTQIEEPIFTDFDGKTVYNGAAAYERLDVVTQDLLYPELSQDMGSEEFGMTVDQFSAVTDEELSNMEALATPIANMPSSKKETLH